MKCRQRRCRSSTRSIYGTIDAWRNIRPDIEQKFEVAAVARLAAGQMEGERQAVEIDLEVDFGREAAARTGKRLVQ